AACYEAPDQVTADESCAAAHQHCAGVGVGVGFDGIANPLEGGSEFQRGQCVTYPEGHCPEREEAKQSRIGAVPDELESAREQPPLPEGGCKGDQEHAEVDRQYGVQDALARGEAAGLVLDDEIDEGDEDFDCQRGGEYRGPQAVGLEPSELDEDQAVYEITAAM